MTQVGERDSCSTSGEIRWCRGCPTRVAPTARLGSLREGPDRAGRARSRSRGTPPPPPPRPTAASSEHMPWTGRAWRRRRRFRSGERLRTRTGVFLLCARRRSAGIGADDGVDGGVAEGAAAGATAKPFPEPAAISRLRARGCGTVTDSSLRLSAPRERASRDRESGGERGRRRAAAARAPPGRRRRRRHSRSCEQPARPAAASDSVRVVSSPSPDPQLGESSRSPSEPEPEPPPAAPPAEFRELRLRSSVRLTSEVARATAEARWVSGRRGRHAGSLRVHESSCPTISGGSGSMRSVSANPPIRVPFASSAASPRRIRSISTRACGGRSERREHAAVRVGAVAAACGDLAACERRVPRRS